MSREETQYRCFVCQKKYFPEDLGRVRLPLVYRRQQQPWFRTVCVTCYNAIVSSWSEEIHSEPPAFHGF